MRFSSIFAVAATFVASAMACDTSAATAATGNTITAPLSGETITMNSNLTITWIPSTSGKIDILLLAGPTNDNLTSIATIAKGLENSGSYIWTVPDASSGLRSTLTSGYAIKLIDSSSCTFQTSSNFGIENPIAYTKTVTLTYAAITRTSVISKQTPLTHALVKNTTAVTWVTAASGTGTGTAKVTSPVLLPTKSMTVPASLQTSATTAGTVGKAQTTLSAGLAAPTAIPGFNAGVMVVVGLVGAMMI